MTKTWSQRYFLMINLFNINTYNINTTTFSSLVHDSVVTELEEEFAEYVGAKYACSANSASSLLFLALSSYEPTTIRIPSTMPIVVPNVITNTGHEISFYDDIDWVGHCYHLHDNIFDSAQQTHRNIYSQLQNDKACMIFSFYPTKPVGSCDGGMVVSNNPGLIDYFRVMTMNGTKMSENSWQRKQEIAGYKMHMNSLQAEIAHWNLQKLDNKNTILQEIKEKYNKAFGLNNTSNHLYRIRVDDNKKFIDTMKKQGILCGIHYSHCHNKTYFNCEQQNLPLSEKETTQTVSIPFHENLSISDTKKVIKHVHKASEKHRR